MSSFSLTTKMSLMVFLLLAGVLSGMTLTTSWYLQKQFITSVSAQQFNMITTMADEIDGKIRTSQLQLAALAGTVTPEILASPERAQHFLQSRPDTLAVFDSGMILFSAQGQMLAIAPFERHLIGGDYSFRDYYQTVARTGKPLISEPFISTQQHRHPTVIFLAPIFDASGKLIGILGGLNDLLKDNYLGKMAHAKLGEKGYFYLYNNSRTLIVHPDSSRILKRDVPVGVNRLFDQAIAGFEGTGETVNSRGLQTFSSFKRLNSTGWILASNSPQSEVYAPLQKAKSYLLRALLAALFCTLLVSWLFMRHLTAPLVTFIRHVQRFTDQEQEPEPILIQTRDEIGTLALAFNKMVQEVHRQKRAALAQEAFSENLLQNSSVATYVLDHQHRVIIWSRDCEELTGLKASQVVGTDQPWRAFYPEKRPVLANLVMDGDISELSALYGSCTRSLLAPDGLCAEGWFPSLNGRERFLCFDAAPIRDAEGKVVAAIETLMDITERKQAEESLSRSEEWIRLLLDSIAEAVYGIDLTGACTFANPSCARRLGYEVPDQLLGRNMHQLIHHTRPDGSHYPGEECPFVRVLRGEEGIHLDDEIFWRADGSCFAVEVWSYPKRRDGEVVGGVVTFFDITKRRRDQVELREALAAAEAATRAKSEFLASMSHEIRTPMNAALGMLYLLQQTGLTERQKNYLDKAQTASIMLLRVINDILDFSKIEAGKLDLESSPFRLAAVLADLFAVVQAALGQKPIKLFLKIDPQLPDFLLGDPLRLGQVLLNLTSNAVKFTENGKVEVEVALVACSDSEAGIRFSVTDTGIGMAQQQQAELFNAFTQADSSTTRRYGGTGLGLPISKQLVELMGGTISVASEQGQGSTFSFTIRFLRQSKEQEAAALSIVAPAGGASRIDSGCHGVRILLVEDNSINQEVAREILERRGVQVDLARNGAEALQQVAACGAGYHAVLMDVHMPVMDGLEATRRMRLDPALAGLPIIAMTASALPRERQLCMEAGMNDQVNKPIDVAELFTTLMRWVGPQADRHAEPVLGQAGWAEAAGFPAHLPGIDLKRALKIVESAPLLRRLLISFRRENVTALERLREAVSGCDWQRARLIVHNVKGVAGNLGATGLCHAASSLEKAMQQAEPDALSPVLENFRGKLAELLQSILLLGGQDEGPAPIWAKHPA